MSTTTPLGGHIIPEDDDTLAQVYAFIRSLAGDLDRTIVRKAANENVISSTAVQDDNDLFFDVEAGKTYAFEFNLFFTTSSSTIDAKVALSFPAGTCTWGVQALDNAAGAAMTGNILSAGDSAATSTTTTKAVGVSAAFSGAECTVARIVGTFVCTTSGTLRLRWAQNASTATNLTLTAGSYLRAEVI